MTPSKRETRLNRIASGAYTGFVEWRSPPDRGERTKEWVLGFFAGFAIKLILLLGLGAEFIPTQMTDLDPTQLTLVGMESNDDVIGAMIFDTESGERVRLEGEMRVVDRFD